jgi:hypothetical protein
MKAQTIDLGKLSFWQLVFSQSKVNGAPYTGEWLSLRSWKWPENTYLQRRLKHLRRYRSSDFDALHQLAADITTSSASSMH